MIFSVIIFFWMHFEIIGPKRFFLAFSSKNFFQTSGFSCFIIITNNSYSLDIAKTS